MANNDSAITQKLSRPPAYTLPANDVQEFRHKLDAFLSVTDEEGRQWANARWGIYAFYDYDGEPIYVGQTNERLRTRIRRHLTNQRTDAVAMRILDLFEVAEIEIWPLWNYEEVQRSHPDYANAKKHLDAAEYSAYLQAISNSQFNAILNEKIPPVSEPISLPPSLRMSLISEKTRAERGHPDIRIQRRAETLSRLTSVARERGEVSIGLRRVIVIQAVRLTYLAAKRLAYTEGREIPTPEVIDMVPLVGNILSEDEFDPKQRT